jgi:cell division septal protein FtsQ
LIFEIIAMFGKNQKKLNYRVRFQNAKFKRRLTEARGYKRPQKSVPDGIWEISLAKIGLGSWISRILTLLVFFFLVYLAYIPNIFFIKQVTVRGLSGEALASVNSSVNSFLEKKIPWPQRNLGLLSKNKLTDFLLKNNQKVLRINKIEKHFPSTLFVDITQRTNAFIVQTPTAAYSLTGDGLITEVVEPNASGTLPSGLPLIKLNNADEIIVGKPALGQDRVNFIFALQNQLPDLAKSKVSNYHLADLQTPDISVYFKNGTKILFDLNSDVNKILRSLKLLFSQLSDSDAKNLFYIDMRFEDRGYVCSKGMLCVKDINLSGYSASSSPTNLPN